MVVLEFAASQRGRRAIECIHPNAPIHGLPTSSAVIVSLGDGLLIPQHPLLIGRIGGAFGPLHELTLRREQLRSSYEVTHQPELWSNDDEID
jgi:hypothetical protein